ncbi:MAG: DNA-directed RNA polymerase subunit beta', partial [Oscillospiraceae bacterium]|nr:DNA-directed RNA polymerase subunit beta' [Oscillospiraceae bacterium]
KQGRFRQNLLGKRVDYSGRSVIVVGPELKIYQCGLPKEMALELFRPFVMKKLVEDGLANNIKSAKKMVDRGRTEVWDALETIICEHPVLLNRAPTLHRLGIQAFEPVLVEGRALKLHPLVCTAYNADFDGDQMAVHVPLSAEAQAEARLLMLSANNLLRPQDGQPVTVPTQDMVLGSYYLTFEREELGEGHVFSNPTEALLAYNEGAVGIHSHIVVRITKEVDGESRHQLVKTTVGRIIFNEVIPQDLGFVDRSDPENLFEFEINFTTGKKQLGKIIEKCIAQHGFTVSAEVLDQIKALGFKYSTQGALTISISDMAVPEEKAKLIAASEKKIVSIDQQYRMGFITDDERYRLVVSEWDETTKKVTAALQNNLDRYNPIFMMADSGARGTMNQIRQLAGMRGLMANTAGKTIEIPIKANFREGLSVLEYFISSRGARKGLADTALRTADSGYLTRRLVDVAQDVIIREEDCGTEEGITVSELSEHGQVIEVFADRLRGRYPVADIYDKDGNLLISKDKMMDDKDAALLQSAGISEVKIRSVLCCHARSGVCSKCYGVNLAIGEPVGLGEAVGIIAAQSIGEPGTQLTMRTFHTGGVAGDDITQGLPRVEELFEARKPKKMAQLSEISGQVKLEEAKRNSLCNITVTNPDDGEAHTYSVPYSAGIRVQDGDFVNKGQELTDGALSPHDVLRIRGLSAVHNYLIQEVLRVYRQQGVDINDKHIEVIVRQMLHKVRVEDAGDTDLLSGSMVDRFELIDANAAVRKRVEAGETGLREATGVQLLMGITKASLATDSFLSAASFQETTKVLTEAAIKGKVDHLLGLKENVIIGKLIPAGSGMNLYRDFDQELASYPAAAGMEREGE